VNNAELIVRMLEHAGVRWAFGVPSGPVLPLIEALHHSRVEYVLTASETSAGFMATTVGAMTGVPGVCISTVGPGATNLATGVGAAWLDRAPVIAITCNVPLDMLERRVQMRIDHHSLFAPLTKASLAMRAGNVARQLSQALTLALTEAPGPVHLDLPEDVAQEQATEDVLTPLPKFGLAPVPSGAFDDLQTLLQASRRPLLVTGLDITRAGAPRRLLEFIDKQRMPWLATLHAKGFLPESHALYAGVLGRARRSDVQRLVERADLIVAVGYDPVEINYEEWVGDKPVVHIGVEATEMSRELLLPVNTAGDLDGAFEALATLPAFENDWTEGDVQEHRRNLDANLRPRTGNFDPHEVIDALRAKLPPDGILAYDVGAHTHQIAIQWRTDEPWTCISTNGWSSMGFGMPAAYAAKLVHPDRTVTALVGDGCFAMTAGELTMARRLGLNVPVVVLNDGWLSLIKVKQQRRELAVSGVRLGDPPPSPEHYFGVPARGVREARELFAALDWAFAHEGPTVIEAFVDAESYLQTVYD
jgi:acetolactate synthase I/II/III large subunit